MMSSYEKTYISKEVVLGLLLGVTAAFIAVALSAAWYRGRRVEKLSPGLEDSLKIMAWNSLPSLDVPVAAVLFYRDSIIGRGWDTVRHHLQAGEHAEMNAISDALKHMGWKKFFSLDRDSLRMVTSLEPFMMCSGALLEYNIKNVSFVKAKPRGSMLRDRARFFLYDVRRRKVNPDAWQDSLFSLQPEYSKIR